MQFSTKRKENYESNQTFHFHTSYTRTNTNNRLKSRIIETMKRSHCYLRFCKVHFMSSILFVIYYILTNSIRFTINSIQFSNGIQYVLGVWASMRLCLYCIQFFIVVFFIRFHNTTKKLFDLFYSHAITTISLELITRLWIQFENNFK